MTNTAQKMKFSIKDLFRKCDQIHSFQLLFLCISYHILPYYLKYHTVSYLMLPP